MGSTVNNGRLSNHFFRENPLMELSAAIIAHYTITARLDDNFDRMISDIVGPEIDSARREKILQERQYIESTEDPNLLVEVMRKGYDIFNQKLLCAKIAQHHKEAMPLLLRRYRTCMLDPFIDAATVVLATGEKQYTDMLRAMYGDIRCPFAQACACLVFGMQNMTEEIPFLLHEYERFQREYPDQTYHQHALLALYLLHGKI